MEKVLKSCTGVLLRADITGHPTLFGRNRLIGWIGYALLGQASKGHPCTILILFSIMSYYIISIKQLETYFASFIFLDFRTVCSTASFLTGCVEVSIMHPLDLVKTRFQIQSMPVKGQIISEYILFSYEIIWQISALAPKEWPNKKQTHFNTLNSI